jgi:hypothetical protein
MNGWNVMFTIVNLNYGLSLLELLNCEMVLVASAWVSTMFVRHRGEPESVDLL